MDVDKSLLSEQEESSSKQKEISRWINFKTICKQHKWMILITITIIVIAISLVACIIVVCLKDNNTQQNNTEDKQDNEQNS